jgi:hypothetical protein
MLKTDIDIFTAVRSSELIATSVWADSGNHENSNPLLPNMKQEW